MIRKASRAVFRLLLFSLLSSGLIITNTGTAADIYSIDPDHSAITFRVKHMGITFVFGRFNNPQGTYALDDRDSENSFIDIMVKAADIDTGHEKRDEHLRSPDFFDVQNFPEIIFKSVFVQKLGASTYRIIGPLTLHGITQFVTVEALKTGEVTLPGGEVRTGFESVFTILRSHYGMKTMLGGIADKVELTVSVEGFRRN